jgi:DNA-binding response OmpR family regulator
VRTVLVVEDEGDIRELLRRYLERAGLSVITAGTGAEALRLIDTGSADLLLLDLGLPDVEGLDVLAAAAPSMPVLVLTARSAVQDRVAGLRLGADDYVVKPFSPTEVVLRVQAVLARGSHSAQPSRGQSFGGGRLIIHETHHDVRVAGHSVDLTPHEWHLLMAMAGEPRRVFSRRELVERASGYAFDGYERAVDSHVKNMRHKFGDAGADIIETVVGFGYRLGVVRDG